MLYSPLEGGHVHHLLHHNDEYKEYKVYSIARRKLGVRCLLHREEERRSTLPTPSCIGGQGVGHLLHCKEEYEEYNAYSIIIRRG